MKTGVNLEGIKTMGKALYLGTSLENVDQAHIVHYPVLHLTPLPIPKRIWNDFCLFTHIIFTSKNAVSFCLEQIEVDPLYKNKLKEKTCIVIGASTEKRLKNYGLSADWVASTETQEGVIEVLKHIKDLEKHYFFYPRSALARKNLEAFLLKQAIKYQTCDLYQTSFQKPNISFDWEIIDEIIFTSPSTIDGFIEAFGFDKSIFLSKKLTCIGVITQTKLDSILKNA